LQSGGQAFLAQHGFLQSSGQAFFAATAFGQAFFAQQGFLQSGGQAFLAQHGFLQSSGHAFGAGAGFAAELHAGCEAATEQAVLGASWAMVSERPVIKNAAQITIADKNNNLFFIISPFFVISSEISHLHLFGYAAESQFQ
jgi:hypothetical protein